jgi:hypothetical protein
MSEGLEKRIGQDLLTYAQISRHFAEKSLAQQDWSGLPVPVAGLNLVLEPRYKHKGLEEFRWKECYDEDGQRIPLDEECPAAESDFRRANSWWNSKYQVTVVVVKDKLGRAQGRIQFQDRLSLTLRTLEAAAVWPTEAEEKLRKNSRA